MVVNWRGRCVMEWLVEVVDGVAGRGGDGVADVVAQ